MQRWIEIAPGLRLTGDGAAWLPDDGVLIVADVHVGYELAARRRGGYLPPVQRGAEAGARVVAMAREVGAARVVIAGDLRHSTRDVDEPERAELRAFAKAVEESTHGLALDVVPGNHDRGGSMVGREVHAPLALSAADVTHEPPRTAPVRWTVCGHLHPRVTLRDETGASARYPCALVGERTLVLPAFSDWAGGTEARRLLRDLPSGRWRALPVSGGAVADVGLVLA